MKLVASQYRIRGQTNGRSILNFYGDNGKDVEIEFQTIALMKLAYELRKAAHGSPIPISKRSAAGGRRSLSGPNLPAAVDPAGTLHPNSQFGVEISADFELITTWFNVPNPTGGNAKRCVIGLALVDAEKLAGDLSKAIDLIKALLQQGGPDDTKH